MCKVNKWCTWGKNVTSNTFKVTTRVGLGIHNLAQVLLIILKLLVPLILYIFMLGLKLGTNTFMFLNVLLIIIANLH